MAAHSNGQAIIFLPCGSSSVYLFFPRLISAVTDWMSTILLQGGPAIVRPTHIFDGNI